MASVDARGAEAAADWKDLRSGENYVGYKRTENFTSSDGLRADRDHVYSVKAPLKVNQWGLSGDWTAGDEAIVLNRLNGAVSYCFHSRDLHFVMGPTVPGSSVRFRVLIDGKPPNAEHGG